MATLYLAQQPKLILRDLTHPVPHGIRYVY